MFLSPLSTAATTSSFHLHLTHCSVLSIFIFESHPFFLDFRAVLSAAKPGASWRDLHLLANRVMAEDLRSGGILKGDVDQMMEANLVGRVFQPCGMGHFLGCDYHDVGGYLGESRNQISIIRTSEARWMKLRARKMKKCLQLIVLPTAKLLPCASVRGQRPHPHIRQILFYIVLDSRKRARVPGNCLFYRNNTWPQLLAIFF